MVVVVVVFFLLWFLLGQQYYYYWHSYGRDEMIPLLRWKLLVEVVVLISYHCPPPVPIEWHSRKVEIVTPSWLLYSDHLPYAIYYEIIIMMCGRFFFFFLIIPLLLCPLWDMLLSSLSLSLSGWVGSGRPYRIEYVNCRAQLIISTYCPAMELSTCVPVCSFVLFPLLFICSCLCCALRTDVVWKNR